MTFILYFLINYTTNRQTLVLTVSVCQFHHPHHQESIAIRSWMKALSSIFFNNVLYLVFYIQALPPILLISSCHILGGFARFSPTCSRSPIYNLVCPSIVLLSTNRCLLSVYSDLISVIHNFLHLYLFFYLFLGLYLFRNFSGIY